MDQTDSIIILLIIPKSFSEIQLGLIIKWIVSRRLILPRGIIRDRYFVSRSFSAKVFSVNSNERFNNVFIVKKLHPLLLNFLLMSTLNHEKWIL